jgi:hypothetical protein
MSVRGVADQLGISKSQAARLLAAGMKEGPREEMEAWRRSHATPRNVTRKPKAQVLPVELDSPAFVEELPEEAAEDVQALIEEEENSDPIEHSRRAKQAEKIAYQRLQDAAKSGASHEEYRKANANFALASNVRARADTARREYLREKKITLYYSEAREIFLRPHNAIRRQLDAAPKTLAARLHALPKKEIETELKIFFEKLKEGIRSDI